MKNTRNRLTSFAEISLCREMNHVSRAASRPPGERSEPYVYSNKKSGKIQIPKENIFGIYRSILFFILVFSFTKNVSLLI